MTDKTTDHRIFAEVAECLRSFDRERALDELKCPLGNALTWEDVRKNQPEKRRKAKRSRRRTERGVTMTYNGRRTCANSPGELQNLYSSVRFRPAPLCSHNDSGASVLETLS